ncbi:MAG: hypothetical protein ABEJ55_04840 [Halanaeroarchaeum sp.]
MTDPDDPTDAMLAALEVRKNVRRGLTVGVLVSLAVYTVFVVLPPGTVRSRLYYIVLAFVLAITLGGVVSAGLVARRALRLAREE